MKRLRIVLGTPIGRDASGRYLVNYPSRWAASVARSPFHFYPCHLGHAATLLKRDLHPNVRLVDAGLQSLTATAYVRILAEEAPAILVLESASRTFAEDCSVLHRVKRATGAITVLCGQHPTAFPNEAARHADHILCGEYEPALLDLTSALCHGRNPAGLPGRYPNPGSATLVDVRRLPWPEDEDVSRLAYAGPLPGHRYRQLQVYASRGCPVMCSFCVAAHAYYQKPNWRPRDNADVVAELLHLARRYDDRFEGFFFDEEMHVVDKRRALDLCARMTAEGLGALHHTAMAAYHRLDKDVLAAMRRAGYCQLKLGIETADPAVAEANRLGHKHMPERLLAVLEAAKNEGISVYGTFTVGGLGSQREADLRTGELLVKLVEHGLVDELQVSICTPQPGTPFFEQCRKNSWLVTTDWRRYDGSSGAVVSYPGYPKADIDAVYRRLVHLGHHSRGLRDLRRHGLFHATRRALTRVGPLGVAQHLLTTFKGNRA
ncbi:MAG: hypothetical protein A2284_13885 [Deltaproteobacteria bacterium RIFOXYA12_FULL_61_11]|nr:MAG: hypothetical protein A2284_13885 [Deltaproteobacteria bacterium RIFOXYA12_FULL_61_11]